MRKPSTLGVVTPCPFFSGVAGYVAANMYKKMDGDRWVWNINLTSCLFAGMFMILHSDSLCCQVSTILALSSISEVTCILFTRLNSCFRTLVSCLECYKHNSLGIWLNASPSLDYHYSSYVILAVQ